MQEKIQAPLEKSSCPYIKRMRAAGAVYLTKGLETKDKVMPTAKWTKKTKRDGEARKKKSAEW